MFNFLNRTFSRWSTLRSEAGGGAKKVPSPVSSTPGAESVAPGADINTYQVPTRIDRKYLVWSGQFKNAADIPERVNSMTISKARTWGRIRVNLGTMLLMLFASIFMVYEGKKAMHRGENVTDMNLEWHRKYNEQIAKAKEQASAAK